MANKRKARNKIDCPDPSKRIRMNCSSEEEIPLVCSSCLHDMFESEQQILVAASRNRRRKAARNRSALRERSISATSRRCNSRGRERRNAVKYQRTRPRCIPRRQNQELSSNRSLRSGKRRQTIIKRSAPTASRSGRSRGRDHLNSVKYQRTIPQCIPRRQKQQLSSNICSRCDKRKKTIIKRSAPTASRSSCSQGRKHRNAVKYQRTIPRCIPRRQNQELSSNISLRSDRRRKAIIKRGAPTVSQSGRSRGRKRHSSVKYQRTIPQCIPRRQNQELLSNRSLRSDKRKKAIIKKSTPTVSRSARSRGRKRHSSVKYQRTRPRCTPKQQNQELSSNRSLRSDKRKKATTKRGASTVSRSGRSRVRRRHSSVKYQKTIQRCTPKQQNQELSSNRSLRSDKRRKATIKRGAPTASRSSRSRGRKRHSSVKYQRTRPRCTPKQQNQELLSNRSLRSDKRRKATIKRGAPTASRSSRSRGRKRHSSVKYQRTRPRCTPKQQNQELLSNRSLRSNKRGKATIKKGAPTASRSGRSRGRERRSSVKNQQTRPRCKPRREKCESHQSSRLSDKRKGKKQATRKRRAHATSQSEHRAHGKKTGRGSARSSSRMIRSPTPEGPESIVPKQFLLIYCDPESDEMQNNITTQQIVANKRENLTNQESLKCEEEQPQENKSKEDVEKTETVQVSLQDAPQEQPASSVHVSQNNAEIDKELCDDNPETLRPAEMEEPLEPVSQGSDVEAQLDESAAESEGTFFHVVLVPQHTIEEVIDEIGVDIFAAGDGPHVVDQRGVELVLDGGLMELIQLEATSDELETPRNSNSDILHSQPPSVEEIEEVAVHYAEEVDEDSEQYESSREN